MKTLHLCNRVPYPPHDGGAIGIYDIIFNLSRQGVAVTVLAINTPKHYQDPAALPDFARFLTVFVDTGFSLPRALGNLFSSRPYNFERFRSAAFSERLAQLLQQETFDIIQLEGSQMAWYLPLIRQYSQAPVVLRAHNVEYTIWSRLAKHEKNPFKKAYLKLLASRVKRFEKQYLPQVDAIAAITSQDEERIHHLNVRVKIRVIPAGVEKSRLRYPEPDPVKPRTVFIIGALNWVPNLEGIGWFLTRVWPTVHREFPDLSCHIAGAAPVPAIRNLRAPQVFIHGFVESAARFMLTHELMLVPLLSGGGMRIKILEGMALGKAILTTHVGAEGINCRSGKDILISSDPAAWINYLRQYAGGELPLQETGESAVKLVREQYDNAVLVHQYLHLYQELIRGHLNQES